MSVIDRRIMLAFIEVFCSCFKHAYHQSTETAPMNFSKALGKQYKVTRRQRQVYEIATKIITAFFYKGGFVSCLLSVRIVETKEMIRHLIFET